VEDGFNIVTVRIKDESTVVVRVVAHTNAWCPVVLTASFESFLIETDHSPPIVRCKCSMNVRLLSVFLSDPGESLWIYAIAGKAVFLGIQTFYAEGPQGSVIEFVGSSQIVDVDRMIAPNSVADELRREAVVITLAYLTILC
jgi:hypothetical protein